MVDKITARIKKYPFQTGILLGCIACLLLIGFINLFQDNGRTLTSSRDIIREDYLRMTISEYGRNADGDLAEWRYKHLGRSADSTLELMMADESVSPQLLSSFAEAVGKKEMLQKKLNAMGSPDGGTPSSPRKGLSGFGKTILIILGLIVLCAAGFYAASLVKTKQKQKKRAEFNQHLADEPMDVITPEKARMTDKNTPDTLFDLDSLFPQKTEKEAASAVSAKGRNIPEPEDNEDEEESAAQAALRYSPVPEPEDEDDEAETEPEEAEPEIAISETSAADEPEDDGMEETAELDEDEDTDSDEKPEFSAKQADLPEKTDSEFDLDIKTTVYDFGALNHGDEEAVQDDVPDGEIEETEPQTAPEVPELASDLERPLIETDSESDPDSEDELLRMIRSGKTASESPADELPEPDESAENAAPEETAEAVPEPAGADGPENSNDVLIHYQSSYRVGNDMYDEVFSIDQGETFRGECGIGIGETLNNTEPKAVTAFEVWLFDKDDIHTATWYLMSDFAMSNEGIYDRLQQHGRCEQIRKNGVYLLETETLQVEIRVLELEYGTEMEEKNSYFTNVTFDVIARSKQAEA